VSMSTSALRGECQSVYELMFHPGEVAEIRAIGGLKGKGPWEGSCFGQKGTVSGYFDHSEAFGKAAESLDKAGAHGVYFTLNPCKPALLARAANRLKASINTTTDGDIEVIRWLPIDLDPVRPSGISSTKEELDLAKNLAKEVMGWIERMTGSARNPLVACSGNGYHLMYRLPDLPNTPETVREIRQALEALAHQFASHPVKIDEKVFNPARIWKLYGTYARKGDNTPERPHRQSRVFTKEQTLAGVEINK